MFGRKIKLGKEDVALVLKKEGGIELVIPKQADENAPVSDVVYMLTGLAILLGEGDEKFIKLIEQTMDKVCKFADEVEEEKKTPPAENKKKTQKKAVHIS